MSLRVKCNIIHNRFDRIGAPYFTLQICDKVGQEYDVAIRAHEHLPSLCIPGLVMTDYPQDELYRFIRAVRDRHPEYEGIYVSQVQTPIMEEFNDGVYTYVDLPQSVAEFDAGLSSKTRYNAQWYPKKIKRELGELSFCKVGGDEISEYDIETFYEWKRRGGKYADLHEFNPRWVSHAYKMFIAGRLAAIGFTSETDENVYFINFSYDESISKYSPGMVLYYYIIKDLITIGKTRFYLGGGDYEYKKRYNGTTVRVYSAYIYFRISSLDMIKWKVGKSIGKCCRFLCLPNRLSSFMLKCLAKVFIRRQKRALFYFFLKNPRFDIDLYCRRIKEILTP